MSDYGQADRCCDLVMKGGVTSGILYPPAICRIAERFHLVGIGGTSAGAIAACAAAAAEYRRRTTGSGAGFERLKALPSELAGEGRMLGLFRPDRRTRREFSLLVGALRLKRCGRLARLLWKVRALWALLGHRRALGRVVANGYGLCSGMAVGNPPPENGVAPLTAWLARTLDEIAGKDDGVPLTFGDLRRAPKPPAQAELQCDDREHSIDLRAVTTCISFGRPLELPFDGSRVFAFDEEEWRGLFPDTVVDYLVRAADASPVRAFEGTGTRPLPVGDDLPVVVAARMSLAFPGLFTMVPLFAFDYEDGGALKKVWFSDGGITSNLPIHRFDALFPRWPTLAINLQYTDAEGRPGRSSVDPGRLVHMIGRRQDGVRDLWHGFDLAASPLRAFLGFLGGVFRSAQVWHDTSFLALPGYRDRVVEIWLREDEGGMNLEMPEAVIAALAERGAAAGVELRDRFAATPPDDPLSWDGHRWVRLRSALAGLTEYLLEFRDSAGRASRHERSLAELLASRSAPPTHPFKARQYEEAKRAIEDLLGYVGDLAALRDVCTDDDHDGAACCRPFCGGPRPPVVIGSRARM